MKSKKKCPKCGNEYPVMGTRLFSGEKEPRLAHNFCPSSGVVKGEIVKVCMECKMKEVVAKWNRDKA